jgi:uncharacterized protein YcbK (DUF882 family)
MSPRFLSALAISGLLAAAGLALFLRPTTAPAATRAAVRPERALPAPVMPAIGGAQRRESRFLALPALRIENQTSRQALELKLYDADGRVDDAAAARLDSLLGDARDPKHHRTARMDRRTLQLIFKAAYHFESYEVEVVSAFRKPGRRREGPHGTGAAVDFRLRGVTASMLASYLREQPRTGVGIYTHPKTQYVHLDVRELSFHWLDASPPRRRWREKSIGARDLVVRDAAYTPALDLPEGFASTP